MHPERYPHAPKPFRAARSDCPQPDLQGCRQSHRLASPSLRLHRTPAHAARTRWHHPPRATGRWRRFRDPDRSASREPESIRSDWLHQAFGFTERLRTPPEPDGTIHHAQLAVGEGSVILTGQPLASPNQFIQAVMVGVWNIDQHFERAKRFGARILSPPDSKPFGERQYSAEDLEGHRWAFTESVADVEPEAWGAPVAHIQHRLAQ